MSDDSMSDEAGTPEAGAPDPNRLDPGVLRHGYLAPMVGEPVTVTAPETGPIQMEIHAISDPRMDGPREGGRFSLTLKGPSDTYFHQDNVDVAFPDGCVCRLFTVNNGNVGQEMYYQIVIA